MPVVPDQPLLTYALQLVADKTGLQPDTRERYARQARALATQLNEIVAADPGCDASSASVQNLTDRHVARWINARENAGSSPKTIANCGQPRESTVTAPHSDLDPWVGQPASFPAEPNSNSRH